MEITSTLKRAELIVVKRKVELYEKVTRRRVGRALVVTHYIHDKAPEAVREKAAGGRGGLAFLGASFYRAS